MFVLALVLSVIHVGFGKDAQCTLTAEQRQTIHDRLRSLRYDRSLHHNFLRHTADCKYRRDEFHQRCNCR